MTNYFREEIEIQGKKVILESGKLAKQADGAVLAQCGETIVLSTVVAAKEAKEDADFFPLTVEYREKYYAAGKIPGGFFKREGKPRESEILTARLIDRSLRPLFPDGYYNEVQLIVTLISADKINDPDFLSIIASSAALAISDIPFIFPVGAVKVGKIDNQFVVNPVTGAEEAGDLNIIVAGTEQAITMIEGEAKEISEDEMIDAINTAHDEIRKIAGFIENLKNKYGKPKRQVKLRTVEPDLRLKIENMAKNKINDALKIEDKINRQDEIDQIKQSVHDALLLEMGKELYEEKVLGITKVLEDIEESIIRRMIVDENKRPDGRGFDEIRPIECEIGLLPRPHGSALFTRGQTQALVVTTLGSEEDAQMLDEIEGEMHKHYMLQYNFPPFSVGEVKMLRGVGRREIGHGNLAERALKAVIPTKEEFPYTIQVVSDILESNGSSSMATVCGATLSLMDAGVPIKKPVAGIAMGLVKKDEKMVILTDIQGAEDHFGDMDFKVAGTKDGITAIQMDIKITGITTDVMKKALEKAKKARLFILEEKILKTISEPKKELSKYAPKMQIITINKDRIKDLIGPNGKTIKKIVEETNAKIDIEQNGEVKIFANDEATMDKTVKMIKSYVAEPEIGTIYVGEVVKIMPFGAFVNIMPGIDGLVHISAITNRRLKTVDEVLKEGQKVRVIVKDIDPKTGKISLSMKEVDQSGL
ncbi:MAG: polyribonucleotide nucleotidyltransferase [Candidatus Goldbacteria bacterium]|nr:polyribonucleotide nucleotidyltransferase [Candidatus Goldiibacteriota bacterium]